MATAMVITESARSLSVDPTEWLPDELWEEILAMLPFEVLWSGVCERVCQRWARLMESAPVKRRKREGRWAAFSAGVIKPRELEGHTDSVFALCVGLNGKIYSGSRDKTMRVWSSDSATHLQTLSHTDWVRALAVGHSLDAPRTGPIVYAGSIDVPVRAWSVVYGTLLHTFDIPAVRVFALAVGLDGNVYSGSMDGKINVWSGDGGTHLQTLEGHAESVMALAVGLDGKVYSGSEDKTIRVWSGDDGAHVQTLEGHTAKVMALAVGLDGKVYSGSEDKTIRVWSGDDGAHLQTLVGHTARVMAIAVGLDGKVYSGSEDKTIRVWSCKDGALLRTLEAADSGGVRSLACGHDGSLFSSHAGKVKNLLMW
jgi:WD40 repeat protein